MTIPQILDTIADGRRLTAEEADAAFAALMDGQMTSAQAGAFLLTLRAQGETDVELGAAVRGALARAHVVKGVEGDSIDIVGTGGDRKHSFNCSTAAALVMAGMGYQSLKHGNRAVSSSCGAGDVLESLGYPLDLDPEGVLASLRKSRFAFCFAPHFHPCFKHIGPVRRELGVRTLFNLLGPLINPACPTHLLMGVPNTSLVPTIAKVMAHRGYTCSVSVCGAGGYDEVTTFGPATALRVEGTRISPMEIDPAALGFVPPASEDELRVESRDEAREVLLAILHGQGPKPMMDMVALNVAVAINMLDPSCSLPLCAERARKAVADGVGAAVVRSWGGLV